MIFFNCSLRNKIPEFKKKKVYVGYLYLTSARLHEVLNGFADLIEWSHSKISVPEFLVVGERFEYNMNLLILYKEYLVKYFINIYRKMNKLVIELVCFQNISHMIQESINAYINNYFYMKGILLKPIDHDKKIRMTNANIDINPTSSMLTEMKKHVSNYSNFLNCLYCREKDEKKYILVVNELLHYLYTLWKSYILSKNEEYAIVMTSVLYYIKEIKVNVIRFGYYDFDDILKVHIRDLYRNVASMKPDDTSLNLITIVMYINKQFLD